MKIDLWEIDKCECGHIKSVHSIKDGVCCMWTCKCMKFKKEEAI